MARPTKAGLDYFELDCHMEEKVRLIQAEFGLKGFAIVVKLYQKIYGEFGYYCEWNEDSSLLFMSENGVSSREEKNLIREIVAACIRRGIFSENIFKRYGVLTSAGVQKRYLNAASRRENVELKKEYLLFDVPENCRNVVINSINADRNGVNVCRNPQSRVEKRRVEESREGNSAEPQGASAPACPRPSAAELLLNDGTVYAVSAEELAEWAGTYPAVDVEQEFREMAAWLKNNPEKRKTRRGIRRFIMNWLGAEQDKGNQPQAQTAQSQPKKQNRFINYTQSAYDFAEIERLEREQRKMR